MRKRQDLGGVWRWQKQGQDAFYEGWVPGSVLCDMLRQSLIEDPFWRDNEYITRELFATGYTYETRFEVREADLAWPEIRLVFEGIDTLASIRLNGRLIGSACNMHRRYAFNVKPVLCQEENTLEVELHSPLGFIRAEDAKNDIFYASTGCLPGNAALRKAHYMFGWDWGPQLPDAGIFRPVYLEYAQVARLEDVKVTQAHEGGRVMLTVECRLRRCGEETASRALRLEARLRAPGGGELVATQTLDPGQVTLEGSLSLLIENPQLWWPNGWGSHPLYDLEIRLYEGQTLLDEDIRRVGLRTIALDISPDEWGRRFVFVVNGQELFAMGANYIPQDNLIPRVTPGKLRALVRDAARAHFNMLRVWGGGYYPDDAFYDACDEQGILVWQDLMFACNVYALDEQGAFEENITAEVRDNARRLRHHACLALWCGNNEMEWGWGEEWQRIKGHHPRYRRDYLMIFERILAEVIKKEDGNTPWWPSSPSSGGAFHIPNDPNHGDQHYWEVWHSGKPFTEYRKAHFRFCSEYGFQSFPSIKTIRGFTLPEDRNIFSRVMESHQKNGLANSKIFGYVADYFQYPKDLDSICYISQVLQLKAVQYGVEFWRQNRGRCMGSLYWQFNDCWPVASWASVDYHGRWKALHYGAKRFYAPLAASAREREELSGQIDYYVQNDSREARRGVLEVALMDTRFHILSSARQEVAIAPLSVAVVLEMDFEALLMDASLRRRAFARYRLWEGEELRSQGVTLFVKPKHFEYPTVEYLIKVADLEDAVAIQVQATGFAHYVELAVEDADPVFSDNFFDITDPEGVTVTMPKASGETTALALEKRLTARSVRDSYQTEAEKG